MDYISMKTNVDASSANSSIYNTTTYSYLSTLNATNQTETLATYLGHLKMVTPSNEYFHNMVLSISGGFHDLGIPKWELVLSLLASWIIICLCLVRGVKSAGKAVYFTSLFPYVVLTILLIRGLTLEGSFEGIRYFFVPKWHLLTKPKVWCDAAVQVFFSLSSGWGGIIALSSYNSFKNNALLDAAVVTLGDGLTSIYAGVTIFSVLGYMSHIMNVDIENLGSDGAGLAFIVYPDIVTSLPVSPLWAILFFAMMLALGFGTMISNINTVSTALCDTWPHLLRKGYRPFFVVCMISFVSFLLGLPCTTSGGMFVLQFMDNYCATYSVLVVGFSELLVLGWVYGADRLRGNIEEMMDVRPSKMWSYTWKFVSPFFILAVAVFNFTDFKRAKYREYIYPVWSDVLGAMVSALIVLPIPVVAAYKVYQSRQKVDVWGKIRHLCQPEYDWGPEFGKQQQRSASNPATNVFESQQPLTHSFVNSSSTLGNMGSSSMVMSATNNRRVP